MKYRKEAEYRFIHLENEFNVSKSPLPLESQKLKFELIGLRLNKIYTNDRPKVERHADQLRVAITSRLPWDPFSGTGHPEPHAPFNSTR